jgi:hypothetical protein
MKIMKECKLCKKYDRFFLSDEVIKDIEEASQRIAIKGYSSFEELFNKIKNDNESNR